MNKASNTPVQYKLQLFISVLECVVSSIVVACGFDLLLPSQDLDRQCCIVYLEFVFLDICL